MAQRPGGHSRTRQMAVEDALAMVRLLDQTHLARVRELHDEFYAEWRLEEREVVARQRAAVRELLAGAECLLVAGGHVGELLHVLHVFHLAPHLPRRVVAWSAGAMALTDRVVLFGDRAAQGPAHSEVYDQGLGTDPRPGTAAACPPPAADRRPGPDGGARAAVRAGRLPGAGRRDAGGHRSGRRAAAGRSGHRQRRADRRGGARMTAADARAGPGRLADQPAGVPPAGRRRRRRPVPGALRRPDRRGAVVHVPVARRGGRGVDLPADRRPARPHPDAPAGRQRPVVPGPGAARRAPASSTRSRSAAASTTSGSTTRSTSGCRTARWARRRCASARATRRRTGCCPTPRRGRASSRSSSCPAGRCAATRGSPSTCRPGSAGRRRYPLLVVHDGGDFLQYASMKTVLDNLIHRLDVAQMIVAFTHPGERLERVRRTPRRTPASSPTSCCPNWRARCPSSGSAAGAACWAPPSAAWPPCRRPTGTPRPTARWC